MNESVLQILQREHKNLWEQKFGHPFHHAADAKCHGDTITISDKHEHHLIAFTCCSVCGATQPGDE